MIRTFEEVILIFIKATQNTKRSADDDRLHAKQLRNFFNNHPMNTLSNLDIINYINSRRASVSNATINRELSLLSAAINYVNKNLEWQLPNPINGQKLKEPEARIRWITQEEAHRLVNAAKEHTRYLADFIILGLHTGCRCNELLGLEWARVDLNNKLIYLEAEHTKAAKRRSIPLNKLALQAIASRINPSDYVFCDKTNHHLLSVTKSFKTACKNANIQDFRIHDLRHTCASWLVSAGVPLATVKDLLGHASIRTTEKYAHLAPENVRAAVAILERNWSG